MTLHVQGRAVQNFHHFDIELAGERFCGFHDACCLLLLKIFEVPSMTRGLAVEGTGSLGRAVRGIGIDRRQSAGLALKVATKVTAHENFLS